MAHFILVHGAWHGAWCWYKVVPLLRAAGHRVDAINLPGHGIDRTPVGDSSLDAFAQAVGRHISDGEKDVVLVGHSMGGMVITEAGERYANSISRLVYLAAFIEPPKDETSAPRTPVKIADALRSALVVSEDRVSTTVKDEALRDVFYNDCSDADIELARLLLVPEKRQAMEEHLTHTSARWGGIKRDYVVCLQDGAIAADTQQKMAEETKCHAIHEMDASHSPFFSQPKELVQLLLK